MTEFQFLKQRLRLTCNTTSVRIIPWPNFVPERRRGALRNAKMENF